MNRFMFIFWLLVISSILVACEDESKVKVYDEKILSIEPMYESGFWGKGFYFVVETDVQTYSISPADILNNDSAEDKLYFFDDEDNILDSSLEKLYLTAETYKKLSKEYTKSTGYDLSKENLSIDEFIKKTY